MECHCEGRTRQRYHYRSIALCRRERSSEEGDMGGILTRIDTTTVVVEPVVASAETSFLTLGDDVLLEVLSLLSPQDISSVRKVRLVP